jgi:hypothetical protein
MTREEALHSLGGDSGPKMARLTYSSGTMETVLVDCVDGEGILHSGPDGIEPKGWWTRYSDIQKIDRLG